MPNEVDGERHLQKLGSHWFQSAAVNGSKKAGHNVEWLDRSVLLKACDKYHGIIDEQLVLSTYLYLYAADQSNARHLMTRDDVQAFLELSLFLYLLDSWNSPEADAKETEHGEVQIQGVLDAIFNDLDGREPKDARQVLKYVEANLPNLAQHVHKFVLFRLVQGSVIGGVFTNRVVLDRGDVDTSSFRQLLDKHKMWQLSAVLPAIPYYKSPVDKTQQQGQQSAPGSRRPSYYLAAPFGKGESF